MVKTVVSILLLMPRHGLVHVPFCQGEGSDYQ